MAQTGRNTCSRILISDFTGVEVSLLTFLVYPYNSGIRISASGIRVSASLAS